MVLVDSSVWIDYFRGKESRLPLDKLIDTNNLCINDLILAELVPAINHKKEKELKELLFTIKKTVLAIKWNRIIDMQTANLKNGINNVGISDLIIAQNAADNGLELFAIDKHFSLICKLHGIKLYKG